MTNEEPKIPPHLLAEMPKQLAIFQKLQRISIEASPHQAQLWDGISVKDLLLALSSDLLGKKETIWALPFPVQAIKCCLYYWSRLPRGTPKRDEKCRHYTNLLLQWAENESARLKASGELTGG